MTDSGTAAPWLWRWAARTIAALRGPPTGNGDAHDVEERVFHPRETWQGPSAVPPKRRTTASPKKVDA